MQQPPLSMPANVQAKFFFPNAVLSYKAITPPPLFTFSYDSNIQFMSSEAFDYM